MSFTKVRIVKESLDIDRRLSEMRFERSKLLKVRTIAFSASADATPNHPANAAGTFAYQQGTWGLRNELVSIKTGWKKSQPNGVEAIINEELKLMVAYANVDLCCNDDHHPKPRSRKGAGAERLSNGSLFDDLPEFVRGQPDASWATYYLMVDIQGAAELSLPVIAAGTFKHCIERIYLSDGSDLTDTLKGIDTDDVADDFNPKVARKR